MYTVHTILSLSPSNNTNCQKMWYIYTLPGIDYTILRPLVVNDASVETVNSSQVVTSRFLLKDFGMK